MPHLEPCALEYRGPKLVVSETNHVDDENSVVQVEWLQNAACIVRSLADNQLKWSEKMKIQRLNPLGCFWWNELEIEIGNSDILFPDHEVSIKIAWDHLISGFKQISIQL